MKSLERDTRAKLSYNPTGELVRILTRIIKIKIARKLRGFRAAVAILILPAFFSCSTDDLQIDTCITGDCNAIMVFPNAKDTNGYYHVKLDWTREYLPYFAINVEATPINPQYRYNSVSVVEANFDSDTTWVIGDSLVFTEPTYRPFTGDYTYSGTPLPSGSLDIILSQFNGMRVNIVQPSPIYFSEQNGVLYSKRLVGPIPPTVIGDTITIYMEVFWEAGNNSILKSDFSEKFIVE